MGVKNNNEFICILTKNSEGNKENSSKKKVK